MPNLTGLQNSSNLQKVPDGDWFCDRCRPKEKTPRKRRKLFRDEAIVEEIEDRCAHVCMISQRVIEASLCRGRHLLNPPVRQECAPEIHLHRFVTHVCCSLISHLRS
ncbi:unnamed protein product [Leptidea sinapis]|uniref:PHD-type domain-containing protein n=1 Tax=Leptidea sinapis TaxID=189913 RepID=A0A5E4R521_9NEOP|nr:unnamed protein product [Leptidea sinapis]